MFVTSSKIPADISTKDPFRLEKDYFDRQSNVAATQNAVDKKCPWNMNFHEWISMFFMDVFNYQCFY